MVNMDEREVTDGDGTTWTCVQALAAVSEDAGQVEGNEDMCWVVCTPSGGAQSVRVQMSKDWKEDTDESILNEIAAAPKGAG